MSFVKFKRKIEEGDTVILYVGVTQIYAIEVKPQIYNKKGVKVDYMFQTRYGGLKVMDLVGKDFGSKIYMTKGYGYALYPTPELWTLTLPHRTQILYTPDISLVIFELELCPGSVICEAGTGSGSLSHAFLRTIGHTGFLHTCDFHQERVNTADIEFKSHGFSSQVSVSQRDVCLDGWGVQGVADAVFLDVPKPWGALTHAVKTIKQRGGRICCFSPCIEQVTKTCQMMRSLGLCEIKVIECLQREFHVKSITLPSINVQKRPLNEMKHITEKRNTNSKKIKSDDTPTSNDIPDTKPPLENLQPSLNDLQEAPQSTDSPPPKDVDGSTTFKEDEKVKYTTGIPSLRMSGHTGYLTFATVPPNFLTDLQDTAVTV